MNPLNILIMEIVIGHPDMLLNRNREGVEMWADSLQSPAVLDWLLEVQDPGARYLAMRDLLVLDRNDPELAAARHLAHMDGPISRVLSFMDEPGYWAKNGPGYTPKYYSAVWSLILLAQLGASIEEDERIAHACGQYLDHAITPGGLISTSGTPGGTIDCVQGNLCWALTVLRFDDPRLTTAYDWMARSETGKGVAPMKTKDIERRYYSGKCGPNFACGANGNQPCAWGAVKVMLAFSVLPEEKRTPEVEAAIRTGVDFLFSIDPATGDYPHAYAPKPSGNWWKFGFPVFYITDLLQLVEAMTALGYGQDPRMHNVIQMIREKQDQEGRWPLEYGYSGKVQVDFGEMKKPNKWVTIRALRALKRISA